MKLAGAKSCMVTSSVRCMARMRTCDPLMYSVPLLYQRLEPPQLSTSLQSPLTCVYNPATASSFVPYGPTPSIRRLSTNVVRVRATAPSQRHQVFPSNGNCAKVQNRKRRLPLYGFFFLASSTIWMIAIFPFVVLAGLLARVFDPKRQRPAAALIQVRYSTCFCWYLYREIQGVFFLESFIFFFEFYLTQATLYILALAMGSSESFICILQSQDTGTAESPTTWRYTRHLHPQSHKRT